MWSRSDKEPHVQDQRDFSSGVTLRDGGISDDVPSQLVPTQDSATPPGESARSGEQLGHWVLDASRTDVHVGVLAVEGTSSNDSDAIAELLIRVRRRDDGSTLTPQRLCNVDQMSAALWLGSCAEGIGWHSEMPRPVYSWTLDAAGSEGVELSAVVHFQYQLDLGEVTTELVQEAISPASVEKEWSNWMGAQIRNKETPFAKNEVMRLDTETQILAIAPSRRASMRVEWRVYIAPAVRWVWE